MSIHVDVILRRDTTAEELTVLGSALWHWCGVTAGDAAMYQCVDNQPLADLIAGRFPAASGQAAHLKVWDQTSPNRQLAIDNLRCTLPRDSVEDVLVDGKTWEID